MSLLKIDYREQALIELLQKKQNITFEVCPLEVGDIVFESPHMKIVIERKTEADLYASIKDGRSREQKERLDKLRELDPQTKIIFLIEQIDYLKRATIDFKIIQGSILNTIFRDNYSILFSECIENTVEYIDLLYKKVDKNEFNKQRGSSVTIESGLLKKKLEKSDYIILVLSAIPRVSNEIAKKIVECYSTLDLLIQGFKEKGENMLADINLGKKKLGKKLSSDIYSYLMS